ncbi:MAG: LysM peptidoglycan-binding domain-containing protein [Phycisphaerae bacterium]|nr:LysM peptidoglycan-binding domain-containing protein [Phycisphaerae bacterium]
MALSIRLSLGICLLFISGTTWLLDRVGRPLEAIPSPFVDNAPDGRPLVLGQSVGRTARVGDLAARFQNVSVVDRGVMRGDWDEPEMVIAHVADSLPGETITLPPLVESDEPLFAADTPIAVGEPVSLDESAFGEEAVALADEVEVVEPAVPVEERYVVRRGDSLVRIARRFWSKSGPEEIELLLSANPQLAARPDRLLVGDEIVIPDRTAALSLARSTSQDGPLTPGAHAIPVAAVEAQTTSDVWWYTIQERDSLSGIARRFLNDERRWVEIKKLNRLVDGNKIRPGMRIKLPAMAALVSG